jgi:hypothetical protein
VLRADPPIPGITRESLRDGTYGINDLYDMHEVLDEEDEYRRRADEAAKRDREK